MNINLKYIIAVIATCSALSAYSEPCSTFENQVKGVLYQADATNKVMDQIRERINTEARQAQFLPTAAQRAAAMEKAATEMELLVELRNLIPSPSNFTGVP